jgi:hexosaminidase
MLSRVRRLSRCIIRCLVAAGAFACFTALHAQAPAPALLPMPRVFHPSKSVSAASGIRLVCRSCASDPSDAFTLDDLNQTLLDRGIRTGAGSVTIELEHIRKAPTGLPAEAAVEGYTIAPGTGGLTLTASTSEGMFYAVQTVKQLIMGFGANATLQLASVEDWPAMRWRGMQDDLSRGPVPTLAFQKLLVRTLASYKANVYSPYFEHTQQYTSNPLPAPPGGSISPEDARDLTAYAARYHVTVIPDQEAFGHLHHNLTWEQYSALAETPHGAVLAPGQPGSLTYIDQIFHELATDYPGPFLHIGADETSDLGLGQTKAEVDARGLGPVYLDFLQKVVTDLQPLHRKILFWGDIAQSIVQGSTAYSAQGGASTPNRLDPDILNKLPPSFKQNTIAVAWWYTPHPAKGFASFLNPFTTAGFETWVAPGVNNWSVVWPNSNDALANIQQFVAEGQRQHSTGVLTTTWNDDGESLANNNWYGLLFGAAASWQPGTSSIAAFQQAYGPVFHGDTTGALNQAQQELMICHDILRNQAHVGDGSDGLFWIDPWSKDGQPYAPKLRPYSHELRLHAERALTLIAQARAAYPATTPDTEPAPGTISSSSFAEGGGSASRSSTNAAIPVYNAANAFPSNPTTLRFPDAIDAMELGARRLDFIGLKFQLLDEIAEAYALAQTAAASTDKKLHATVGTDLGNIRSINGRLEDIRDTYALLRELYQQAWLRSNRAYALRPVLEHYDFTVQLWQARIDRFRSVQRQYGETKTLPVSSDLGLPAIH